MLLAINRGAGQNMGFPDTCNTPQPAGTVPIPYPNIAMHAQANPTAQIVRISGMNALNQSSLISMTTGDEAGVAHSSFKQQATFAMGHPLVSIEAMPAICLACPTTGYNMNCSSALVAVPSVTTVFYTMLVGEPNHSLGLPYRGPQASADSSSVDHSRVLNPSQHAALAELMREGDVVAKLVGDDVGYLQIPHFSSMTSTLVFRALRRLGGEALTSLVLDLRGNPGGDTDAMQSLADDFLPPDAVIYRRIDEDGDETSYRARQAEPYEQSLYLLVDGRTASAAELFTGCLQHHRRAVVIGEPTVGKGQMQRIFPTGEDAGALYATIADCRLPDGTELQGRGIEPDVCVAASSPDDTADPVLAMALSLVSAT